MRTCCVCHSLHIVRISLKLLECFECKKRFNVPVGETEYHPFLWYEVRNNEQVRMK